MKAVVVALCLCVLLASAVDARRLGSFRRSADGPLKKAVTKVIASKIADHVTAKHAAATAHDAHADAPHGAPAGHPHETPSDDELSSAVTHHHPGHFLDAKQCPHEKSKHLHSVFVCLEVEIVKGHAEFKHVLIALHPSKCAPFWSQEAHKSNIIVVLHFNADDHHEHHEHHEHAAHANGHDHHDEHGHEHHDKHGHEHGAGHHDAKKDKAKKAFDDFAAISIAITHVAKGHPHVAAIGVKPHDSHAVPHAITVLDYKHTLTAVKKAYIETCPEHAVAAVKAAKAKAVKAAGKPAAGKKKLF